MCSIENVWDAGCQPVTRGPSTVRLGVPGKPSPVSRFWCRLRLGLEGTIPASLLKTGLGPRCLAAASSHRLGSHLLSLVGIVQGVCRGPRPVGVVQGGPGRAQESGLAFDEDLGRTVRLHRKASALSSYVQQVANHYARGGDSSSPCREGASPTQPVLSPSFSSSRPSSPASTRKGFRSRRLPPRSPRTPPHLDARRHELHRRERGRVGPRDRVNP